MNRFENRAAVVTEGASGIGPAFTDRLISEGVKGVVVVGRNAETNAEVAGVEIVADGGVTAI